MFIQDTIVINAPKSKVWDALVNPLLTRQYMFGCETVSNWKVGSELLWKGSQDGKEIIFVKGLIADIQPMKRLIYTAIDPNGPIPDVPENYLTIAYDLKDEGTNTVLSVSQGDYSKVGDGENRYKESMKYGGWEPILTQIKALVEK